MNYLSKKNNFIVTNISQFNVSYSIPYRYAFLGKLQHEKNAVLQMAVGTQEKNTCVN